MLTKSFQLISCKPGRSEKSHKIELFRFLQIKNSFKTKMNLVRGAVSDWNMCFNKFTNVHLTSSSISMPSGCKPSPKVAG